MLALVDFSFEFAGRYLYKNANWHIKPGEKIEMHDHSHEHGHEHSHHHHHGHEHEHGHDESIGELHREDLETFRAFLRSLLMHGAVGTALGGVCTTVGEPQNLLIANQLG